MDSKLRSYVIIGGAIVAAAIIIGVAGIAGAFDDDTTPADSEEVVISSQVPPFGTPNQKTENSALQQYRINTSCEILYAMTASVYPNGERLHSLSITGVVSKYQTDFEPWLETFADDEKLRAFINEGFSPEFLDIFAEKVMVEYSINPELKSLVLMALDPTTTTVDVNKIFEEEGCMEYFVSQQGNQNTQP